MASKRLTADAPGSSPVDWRPPPGPFPGPQSRQHEPRVLAISFTDRIYRTDACVPVSKPSALDGRHTSPRLSGSSADNVKLI